MAQVVGTSVCQIGGLGRPIERSVAPRLVSSLRPGLPFLAGEYELGIGGPAGGHPPRPQICSERRQPADGPVLSRLRVGLLAERHFPWAWKPSELVAVRPVEIVVDHTRRRQRLRIKDHVSVRIRERYECSETVTRVIPGMTDEARN